jgi:hypothetical protein
MWILCTTFSPLTVIIPASIIGPETHVLLQRLKADARRDGVAFDVNCALCRYKQWTCGYRLLRVLTGQHVQNHSMSAFERLNDHNERLNDLNSQNFGL